VTWRQKEDPHWFGARIPDAPVGVEFVEYGPAPVYRYFAGKPLSEQVRADAARREATIVEMKTVGLP